MNSVLKYIRDATDSSDDEYLGTDLSEGDQSDEYDIESDTEYEVQNIIDKRVLRGRPQYLLKWVGYDPQHNSWEPIDIMCCEEMVEDFENKYSEIYGDVTYADVFGDYGTDRYDSPRNVSNDSGIGVTDLEEEDDSEDYEISSEEEKEDNLFITDEVNAYNSDEEFAPIPPNEEQTEPYEMESEDEEFKEPETDDDENGSQLSYDFRSHPTIYDISFVSSSEEREKQNESQEIAEQVVTQMPKIPTKADISQFNIKAEVLSIDDSDEEISICETPGVMSLPFRRPNYLRARRRINFDNIPELVVISDSDEELNTNDINKQTNNDTMERSVENTMESLIAQTVDDMVGIGEDKSCDNNVVNNGKAIEFEANDEDSDQSERELVVDLGYNESEEIENILRIGLILDDSSTEDIIE